MTTLAHIWDKTLAKSDEWLTSLGNDLGVEDPHAALLALRAVLHALRDRLPPDEAVDLAAQMPLVIKGVYFDGWDPSATPVKARSRDAFLGLVEGRLRGTYLEPMPERVTRAVFRLLAARVSQGEIRDVRGALPREVTELWPEESEHGAHG